MLLAKKLDFKVLLLVFIILIGGSLRFYNLNWDEGNMYHPDERAIASAVSKLEFPNQLDPDFYAYNGFSMYLYKGIGSIVSLRERDSSFAAFLANIMTGKNISQEKRDLSWVKDWNKINLVGRFVSAFLATISIYLMYVLGGELIGKWAGVLSAALAALTVGFIQYAHFAVTESLLVFFLLLITFFSVRIFKYNRRIDCVLLGITCGLAIGTKTSALLFLVIPLEIFGIKLFHKDTSKIRLTAQIMVFFILTSLFFFIASPYSVINFSEFYERMQYERSILVTGSQTVPYTLQFDNAAPYLFFYQNLHWYTGLLLPTIGFLSILIWLLFIIKKRQGIMATPLLLFALIYFAYVGSWQAKFIRYMLPLIPVLILSTSWLMTVLWQQQKTKLFGKVLTGILLITTAGWAFAFMSIYINPSTRIAASEWTYSNIPENSTLLLEHWDEGFPNPYSGHYPSQYKYLEMQNYNPDTDEKIQKTAENLTNGDYLIISSRRLSDSIGRAIQKYPITSQYYNKLFQEKLGYELAQKFSSYPRIGSLIINDDSSEESFQTYDHPTVYIFKNTKKLSPQEITRILYE